MDIDELLEEARQKATNYGQMYGEKETADEYCKIRYAQLREDAPKGTAPDMDAWVRRQPEYLEAVERKKNAYTKWKTAETYVKLLFAEKDVWTMKKAIERDLDKAHL